MNAISNQTNRTLDNDSVLSLVLSRLLDGQPVDPSDLEILTRQVRSVLRLIAEYWRYRNACSPDISPLDQENIYLDPTLDLPLIMDLLSGVQTILLVVPAAQQNKDAPTT